MKKCLRNPVLFFPFIHFMVGILGAQPKADAIIGVMVMRADHERLEELATAKWASRAPSGLRANTSVIALWKCSRPTRHDARR